MEPEGSSPYTEEPATCPYPEPDQSSLRPPSPNLSNIHFNIILPSMPGSSKWSPSLRSHQLKPCMLLSSPPYVPHVNLSDKYTVYIIYMENLGASTPRKPSSFSAHYFATCVMTEGKNISKGVLRGEIQNILFKTFLSVLAKLRKVTIRLVMYVCPSARPHGTTRLLLDGFSWNSILKFGKNNEYFTWRRFHVCDNISLNSS
jgi:hypothetical protein